MTENEEEKKTTAEETQTETETNAESTETDAKTPEPQGDAKASGTESTETEKEKTWKTAENARFAELRRKNEELERQLAEYRSKDRENVTEDALRKLGLTRADLDDDDNMALATEYTKALARGDENPAEAAYKARYKSSREAKLKDKADAENRAKLDAETRAKVNADKDAFAKKYPGVSINDLVKEDSEFSQMFGDVPDVVGNITKYYGRYLKLKGAETKKVSEQAKAKSTPFTKGSQSSAGGDELTKEQALNLPKAEFEAYIQRLMRKK